MEQQEKQGIKLLFAYQNKTAAIRVLNPRESIKYTIDKLKEETRNYPDKLWELPEVDSGGGRIKYFLGRKTSNEKLEILKEKNASGDEQSLFDYGVVEGDLLTIIKRTIAG